MEVIDESHKVIGRVNILVHYDPNVKILLNRRLCELVVRLYNVASRHCLPVWKRCEAAIPKCQLALKEFYWQLLLGETLVQCSSSQHFWKLKKTGDKLEYLHSCDSAFEDWEEVKITKGEPTLRCDRLRHHVELVQENDQFSVKHSCLCAGGCDQVPLRFREGKVISLPCISEHWLKLSIVGAPQGAFVVQSLLDLYWHMIRVNRSLFVSEMHEQTTSIRVAHRWQILCCGVILSEKYHKYLAAEREKGLGSFAQCQEDCELLLKKLQYVADQGPRVECESLTEEEPLHKHRHDIAAFVLKHLADRYQVADKYRINYDGRSSPSPQNPLSNIVWLPQYLNIDHNKVKRLRYISRGAFGSVFQCQYLGDSLAAKVFSSTNRRDTFPTELENLCKLKHSHIVQLRGYSYSCFTDEKPPECQLLVERLDGDLSKRFSRLPPFPLHVAVDILLQIARAMKYLHESGVMHRDLKATNVLVKRIMSNGNSEGKDLSNVDYLYVKLTDFGLATQYEDPNLTGNVGTSFWRAPEVLGPGEQEYSKPADVYSFAVTCFEIFGGKPSEVWKVRDMKLYRDALNQGERPSVENCPAYLVDYIGRCWDTQPENRPSFVDICVVLLHYKSVLMKADQSADFRISTEEDMIELACQGGLKWLTREVLKNGIDRVDVDSNYSRIPMDLFLDCLGKWEYPKPKSGDSTGPASPSAPSLNLSAGVELSPQDSSGSLLEGFEKLCVVHYEWQDVLKGLPEAWVHVGDYYASWGTKVHDFGKALTWFEKASNHGLPDSFVRVGMCYESGYGTERNFELAVQNYEKAASKHSSAGYVYLGLAYAAMADRKEEGLQFWQKVVLIEPAICMSSRRDILVSVEDKVEGSEENVYGNVVTKLLRMTMKENSIGRKLVAGPAPKCANVRLVVDAVRKATVKDKKRSTKVAILRNLSTEPDIAEKIKEAGGAQVLISLWKESCKPDSKLVSKMLVETFCNVIHKPIEQEQVLESFRQDGRDPTSVLTPEEMEKFRSKIQTYLHGLEENSTSSPEGFQQTQSSTLVERGE